MHYYLARYRGTGTDEDPYRPATDVDGWSAIDLRADATQQAGRCLLALPVRQDPPGALYLGDDADAQLSAAGAQSLGNALGVTLVRRDLRQIAAELLIDHARMDGTRWRPLRPMVDGWLRIFLGGMLWEMAPIGGGATITDNFNRDDSDTLGTSSQGTWSWTSNVVSGGFTFDIVSNQARGGGTAAGHYSVARADSNLATDDHYSQAVINAAANAPSGVYTGLTVRMASAADTYYWWGFFSAVSPENRCQIWRRITASNTVIYNAEAAGTHTSDPPAGGTFKLKANGSTVSLDYAGSVNHISVTDNNITGNVRAGLFSLNDTVQTGINNLLDNFEAGDLGGIIRVSRA